MPGRNDPCPCGSMQRSSGWYANRTRGRRRAQGTQRADPVPVATPRLGLRVARQHRGAGAHRRVPNAGGTRSPRHRARPEAGAGPGGSAFPLTSPRIAIQIPIATSI